MWTSNRLCEAAILQRKADIHRQRLREIKCSIDTRDPRRPQKGNAKAARLEEERNHQIMCAPHRHAPLARTHPCMEAVTHTRHSLGPCTRRHENTILLEKLSKILTREKSAQAGGWALPAVAAPPTAGGGLHDIYRRKVREQIDRENQQLLRRLQYMKPSIDMLKYEQQWQEHAHFAMMGRSTVFNPMTVSYTHLTLPTILLV